MTNEIRPGLIWAAMILATATDDHLLEIGGGVGLLAGLICERLVNGTLTLVDRSEAAVEAARRRNQAAIEGGKLRILQADLLAADFGRARFDKVYAMNVNLFWTGAAREELALIRRLLQPGGRLYLFFEPPDRGKGQSIVNAATVVLQDQGYVVSDSLMKSLDGALGVGLIARPG